MKHKTACPVCGKEFDVQGLPAGQHVRCASCKAKLTVAAEQQLVPTPAPNLSEPGEALERVEAHEPDAALDTQGLPDLSADGYRILSRVGEGGMGTVYKGEQALLERTIAIKTLKLSSASDSAYLKRFLDQAKALVRISHPNLLQVLDVRSKAQMTYLCLEWVEGESLAGRLRRDGKLSPAEARDFLRQAAKGLAAAHEAGVVHGDIKPSNLLVTSDGALKITDFGLAKSVAAEVGVNRQGTIFGTPLYISPEQAQGGRVEPWSDIYCLGATFFHLLAGKPPFTGVSTNAVLKQHLETVPPPLRTIDPEIPEDLAEVVAKMLATSPWNRFQSGALLDQELGRNLATAGREGEAAGGPSKEPALSPGGAPSAGQESDVFAALQDGALPTAGGSASADGELQLIDAGAGALSSPEASAPAAEKSPPVEDESSGQAEVTVELARNDLAGTAEGASDSAPAAPAGAAAPAPAAKAPSPTAALEALEGPRAGPSPSAEVSAPETVDPRPDKCPHCTAAVLPDALACPICGRYVPSREELKPVSPESWQRLAIESLLDPLSGKAAGHLLVLSAATGVLFALLGTACYQVALRSGPIVSRVAMGVFLVVAVAVLLAQLAERMRIVAEGWSMQHAPPPGNPLRSLAPGVRLLAHAGVFALLPILAGLKSSLLQGALLGTVALCYPLSLRSLLSGGGLGGSLSPKRWLRPGIFASWEYVPAVAGAAALMGGVVPLAALLLFIVPGGLAAQTVVPDGNLVKGLVGLVLLAVLLALLIQYCAWVSGGMLVRAWRRNARLFEPRTEGASPGLQKGRLMAVIAGMSLFCLVSCAALYPLAGSGLFRGSSTVRRLILGPPQTEAPAKGNGSAPERSG